MNRSTYIKYTTMEERIVAFKRAIDLRGRWVEAASRKASRKEMEELGLKTVCVKNDKSI